MIEINEIFFLHQTADFDQKFKNLFKMYYEIAFFNEKVQFNPDDVNNRGKLKNLFEDYKLLYEEVQEGRKKLITNHGRAIVVFKAISDKNMVE